MSELPFPPQLSASVDWYSASVKDDDSRKMVHRLAEVIGQSYVKQGIKAQGATWKGYDLTRVGNISYGIRADDSYIELRSTAAAEWWLSFAPYVHNVARLDLAVTWEPPKRRVGLAHGLYREVSRTPDRGHMPPQLRYWETYQGGQTFYVGSVKSDKMARIYDKGIEMQTRPSGELWRYELQLRNKPANAVSDALLKSERRGWLIAATVATFLEQRYCPVAWRTNVEDVPIVVHRPKSDDEVKKRWIISTVRPVLTSLGHRVSREELLSLTGLDSLDSRV